MSAARDPATVATDAPVADILRFIARTCLEIERGLRPPEHLRKLMDPDTGWQWSRSGKIGRFHGGPVQDDHIADPHFTRHGDGQVAATVVTRTQGDRWGALTLRLQPTEHGRWRIAEIQRLLAASHYRAGPSHTHPPEATATRRLQVVTEDRRLAQAAHQAVTRRLADLAPGSPGYRATRDLARNWTAKLAELDRELTDLKMRHDTRQHTQRLFRH